MSKDDALIHDGDQRTHSRRPVLRTGAATAGVAATTGVAAGQTETTTDDETVRSPLTTQAAILEQENIQRDLVGFWIHLARELDPIQAGVADQCDVIDWGDRETLAFDA